MEIKEFDETIVYTPIKEVKQKQLPTYIYSEILSKIINNKYYLYKAIQNSSNSLGEAMLVGVLCISSATGGTMDMLYSNVEGYMYEFKESVVLVEYIKKYLVTMN